MRSWRLYSVALRIARRTSSRRSVRCTCGYDLSGLTGVGSQCCPECGIKIDQVMHMARPLPRIVLLLALLPSVLITASSFGPRGAFGEPLSKVHADLFISGVAAVPFVALPVTFVYLSRRPPAPYPRDLWGDCVLYGMAVIAVNLTLSALGFAVVMGLF
jgi:hypothetical protein